MSNISLSVRGINIPSFKNNKMIAQGRLITNPKRQKVMEQITASFVLQCISGLATSGGAMPTVPCPRSLTASLLPEDDSWQWIPEIRVVVAQVPKGSEGCDILIEPL